MSIVIADNYAPPENSYMNEPTHIITESENQHESTYALLIRSEEKSRNLLELAIYPLLILGVILAIWQFAHEPVNFPVATIIAVLRS